METLRQRGEGSILSLEYFEILNDGKVEVEMIDQLRDAIENVEVVIDTNAATPSKHFLFDVREHAELLDKKLSENFHMVVAKLLYIMKRTRPDLEPTVTFLSTRVSKPTINDWKKLKRLLQFIRGTINDKRVIGSNSLDGLITWIDATYTVHMDMHSHTGGCISFGWGATHALLSK